MARRAGIAFYTDARTIGGAEVSLGALLSELDPGYEAVVMGVERNVVEWLRRARSGASSKIVPEVRGKRDLAGFLATWRAIHGSKADIFHANLDVPSACQYALAAAALTPQLKTVAVEQLPYPLDGSLQLRLKRFTSRRLAAHVGVGHVVGRMVEELAGLPDGSLRTIHNGVPDIQPVPVRRPFDDPTVCAIGRLDRQKGFDVLLRALAQVPEARLVLVGEGAERHALEGLAGELGIAERVRFEGWREDARRYLTAADAFVLPSRFEGFPLAVVEAMLAGLPVVATPVGSVPEAVIDGDNGFLVPVEDAVALAAALRTLCFDRALGMRMGARGRQLARPFTSAAMARSYERLYEEILT